MEFREMAITEAAKASPPVTVGAMTLYGVPLSDWVLALTALYTVVQLLIACDKWWRERKRERNKN